MSARTTSHERRGRNAARISLANSSGSSQAAKWPPRSTSLKYDRLGYDASAQLRGVAQISPGNEVNPTGIVGAGGGALPAAGASGPYASQYDRAAEAPVPVSQYAVMLSRTWSRVRLPEGCPSTNARAIL